MHAVRCVYAGISTEPVKYWRLGYCRWYACTCHYWWRWKYSGTPPFRTSEMRTSCFNGRFAQVRTEFPLTAINYNPWNADTPLFCKADKFFSPFSTWTVHNSLDNADAHLPLMQVCHLPLIDSTTGHYNSIGSHSSSLWSAFLASVQQGRVLERALVALNSRGTLHALPCLPEIYWKPPKYRHLYNLDTQW